MTDILSVFCGLLSGLVLMFGFMVRPVRISCPHGWWIPEGVRRANGEFACRPKPVGGDERLPNGHLVDHSVQPDGHLYMRVYCEPNAIPTIVDTTVLCTKDN